MVLFVSCHEPNILKPGYLKPPCLRPEALEPTFVNPTTGKHQMLHRHPDPPTNSQCWTLFFVACQIQSLTNLDPLLPFFSLVMQSLNHKPHIRQKPKLVGPFLARWLSLYKLKLTASAFRFLGLPGQKAPNTARERALIRRESLGARVSFLLD